MSVVWNQSMATGVDLVDDQHRELFRNFNKLGEAMKQGQGRGELGKLIEFLSQYVVKHFSDEERLMEKYACPVAGINKQAHARLLATLAGLRERFSREGATSVLVLEIQNTLSEWLVKHIEAIDKQLGKHALAELPSTD